MATLAEIFATDRKAAEIITDLKDKSVVVPSWAMLEKEYNPKKHPVMNKRKYQDVINEDGTLEPVTRITLDLMRLTAKRMTELLCGIPVKRVYKAETDGENEVAQVLESILQRSRIDSVNVERWNMLFAGCEVATLWYAVEQPNNLYGISSKLKLRCRNFSPMQGDSIYPLFDEYGDLVAMSFGYQRKIAGKWVEFFDTYTDTLHIKWKNDSGWEEVQNEQITLGKIPSIYTFRPTPIWEDAAGIVYEIEWALSRNGNYLRKNSKPVWVVCADEEIETGQEKSQDSEFRSILQYPKGSSAQYVTWAQAIENLKFYVQELRQQYYSQLQMPDFSMDNMKTTPMSGEARKMVFIDAQLKVKDESGRILEYLDREVNVVKAFLKVIMPDKTKDIDSLQVETIITPFTITDEKETISNLMTATGGKPILSQREGVENLGWSSDVDATMKQLAEENSIDVFSSAR
jgi:hypothetical protein